MSTMLGFRPLHRSAKVGLGLKDAVPGKVTYINLDNARTYRDLARHATLGQVIELGPARFQLDSAQVVQGGSVAPRTGSLVLDVTAANVSYLRDEFVGVAYTKGGTGASAAGIATVTPDATNPLLAAIGLNTASTAAIPTIAAVLAGTASAIATEDRARFSVNTLPVAQLPALDSTADRTWLALVWVPPALAVTSVAATDVFTTSAHKYQVGDPVWFSALTGGAGLTANQVYFVNTVPSATTFTVSATLGGPTFDHTTNITASTVQKQILAQDVLDIRP